MTSARPASYNFLLNSARNSGQGAAARLLASDVERAGLDYWPEVELHRHRDLDALKQALPAARLLYFTTKAQTSYAEWPFAEGDCLVFGPETRGLPEELLRANWERCLTIPMPNPRVRSLNLATSVGVALYEALRQAGALGRG